MSGGHGATATLEPATVRGVILCDDTTHGRVMSDDEFGTDPLATLHEELETALDAVEDDEASYHLREAMQHAVAVRETWPDERGRTD